MVEEPKQCILPIYVADMGKRACASRLLNFARFGIRPGFMLLA